MSVLLAILRAATIVGVLTILAPLTLWAGPDFEARVWPVLDRQEIESIDLLNGGRLACWTWRFDKVRPALIVDAGWTLRDGDTVYPYERVRTVADSEDASAALPARPVKAGQWSRKCMDVPAALLGRPFRLTGFVEYRTPLTGRLWVIRQPTAEASVE